MSRSMKQASKVARGRITCDAKLVPRIINLMFIKMIRTRKERHEVMVIKIIEECQKAVQTPYKSDAWAMSIPHLSRTGSISWCELVVL